VGPAPARGGEIANQIGRIENIEEIQARSPLTFAGGAINHRAKSRVPRYDRFTRHRCHQKDNDMAQNRYHGPHNRSGPSADEVFERSFRKLRNKEARVYRRKPCSESTHFSANRMIFEGVIKNVSEGGIYVQTRERFTVGQEVIVAGAFDESGDDIKRRGKVVWYDDKGIAVEFLPVAAPRGAR